MATIARCGSFLACISGNNIVVYDLRSGEKNVYKCEKVIKTDPAEQNEQSGDRILSCGLSASGKWFAACDDWKQLTLWQTGPQWTRISVRSLSRRCLALAFTQSEDAILVADKSGDVYSYSVSRSEEQPTLLLGHLSLLLDMVLCGDDKFVVTADRDEKIRVSHHPNAYNIHSFCLGHTNFVSRLAYVKEQDLLLSGSGDGTVKVWDYKKGAELYSQECWRDLGVKKPEDNDKEQAPEATEKSENDSPSSKQKVSSQKEVEMEETGLKSSEKESGSGDEERADVSCLVYDEQRHLVAATFEGMKGVFIYQLNHAETETSLQLLQTVDCAAPWNVTFDSEGQLWVLQPVEGQTLQLYKPDQGKIFHLVDSSSEDKVSSIINSINQDWDFFKGCMEVEGRYKVLHKPKIDNMKEYIERKQQKVNKRKGPNEQEAIDSPIEKKVKV